MRDRREVKYKKQDNRALYIPKKESVHYRGNIVSRPTQADRCDRETSVTSET